MCNKIAIVVMVVGLAAVSWGFSGGAPESVCNDMTPQHPKPPQTSTLPYKVTPDKNVVKAGDKVTINISGQKPFLGLLLQVRDGDKAVGQFQVSDDDKYVKTINCHDGKQNSVTHKNSAGKNDLNIVWVAPAAKKTYTIYITVAENGAVYWVQKKISDIKVE